MDIALFDFDGTITDREMFVAFLEHAVPRRRLALGKVFLAPLVVGYKLGVVPTNAIRAAAVRVGLSGAPLQAVEHAAATFATDVLPPTVRSVALERIRWHQGRGDRVVVVTGALELALRPWCERHAVELVGSQLEHRGGRLTGRYSGPQCLRQHKVSRVAELYDLKQYAAVHAYGDTPDDFALLSLAHHGHYRWQPYKAGANNSSKPTPLRGAA
jgi:HAD superfamily hydrolase (TIGR01490 family)